VYGKVRFAIWDPRTRREVGPLRFSAGHDIGSSRTHGDQLMVFGLDGALPLMLPTPTVPFQRADSFLRIV
jgi:hypothetical protein